MGLLEGKTALITGAARGIGKAIALKFAEEGANIAFTDLEVNEETEKEIAAKGVKAKSYASNAADFAQTEEVVKAIKEEFGSIDILVNNAGITKDGLLARMSEEQFDIVTAVNYKSVFNMTRHVSAVMMKQRSGKIINVSSVAGLYGNAGQFNYSATKAGVVGMTLTAAKELGPRGITVNAIAPGFIETPMTDVLSDELKETCRNAVALKRFGKPEEVASVVSFLAGEDSNYVSGQVIVIDGAMVM